MDPSRLLKRKNSRKDINHKNINTIINEIIKINSSEIVTPDQVLARLLEAQIKTMSKLIYKNAHFFCLPVQDTFELLFTKECLGWLNPIKYPAYVIIASEDEFKHFRISDNAKAALISRNPVDNIMCFIGHLNRRCQTIILPENIAQLISAFFSIYQKYLGYGDHFLFEQIAVKDIWGGHLYRLVNDLLCRMYEIPFQEKLDISTRACQLLSSFRLEIPEDQRGRVIEYVLEYFNYRNLAFVSAQEVPFEAALLTLIKNLKIWFNPSENEKLNPAWKNEVNKKKIITELKQRIKFLNSNLEKENYTTIVRLACECLDCFKDWISADELKTFIGGLLHGYEFKQEWNYEKYKINSLLGYLIAIEQLLPFLSSSFYSDIVDKIAACLRLDMDVNVKIKALDVLKHLLSYPLKGNDLSILITCLIGNFNHEEERIREAACITFGRLKYAKNYISYPNVYFPHIETLFEKMKDVNEAKIVRHSCIFSISNFSMILPSNFLIEYFQELRKILQGFLAGDRKQDCDLTMGAIYAFPVIWKFLPKEIVNHSEHEALERATVHCNRDENDNGGNVIALLGQIIHDDNCEIKIRKIAIESCSLLCTYLDADSHKNFIFDLLSLACDENQSYGLRREIYQIVLNKKHLILSGSKITELISQHLLPIQQWIDAAGDKDFQRIRNGIISDSIIQSLETLDLLMPLTEKNLQNQIGNVLIKMINVFNKEILFHSSCYYQLVEILLKSLNNYIKYLNKDEKFSLMCNLYFNKNIDVCELFAKLYIDYKESLVMHTLIRASHRELQILNQALLNDNVNDIVRYSRK